METLVFETPESEHLFETVMGLPEKYRIVIHLFYYEDYSVREIGEILKISESNVKVRLSRGRMLLRETLKEEWTMTNKRTLQTGIFGVAYLRSVFCGGREYEQIKQKT